MTTDMIDKLFLELSQFTQAKTATEIELRIALEAVVSRLETIRETEPHILLDQDIDLARFALGSNA